MFVDPAAILTFWLEITSSFLNAPMERVVTSLVEIVKVRSWLKASERGTVIDSVVGPSYPPNNESIVGRVGNLT